MSYNDNDLPRTKVAMRGKMLVAWLAEANPPVLWRFFAGNLSSGFSLRHGDGKVDLVHNDGGANSQVIASFTSEASAQRALSRFSHALLSYKAPWKRALKGAAIVLLILLLFVALKVIATQQARSLTSQLQALERNMPAKSGSGGSPLLLPGMAPLGSPAPAGNNTPMGSPIDVDKFYK